MRWFQDTIEAFSRQLGVITPDVGPQGTFQVTTEGGALLVIEPIACDMGFDALVYAGHPVGMHTPGLARRALAQAHLTQGLPHPLQVALLPSHPDPLLIALTRIPGRHFTPDLLAHAVDFLHRWLDDVVTGGESGV